MAVAGGAPRGGRRRAICSQRSLRQARPAVMLQQLLFAAACAASGADDFPTQRPQAGPSFERDDVDRSNARQWVVVESDSCVSFNSIDPFVPGAVQLSGRFHLAVNSSGLPLDVGSVSSRALVLFAPLQWDDLRVAYRAFLHLDAPMQPGIPYTLTATGLNATWNAAPISRTVQFNASALNTNIRLNQVGFLPQQRPKRAWLGQFAGQGVDGSNTPVQFFSRSRAATFEVVDAVTGQVALSGAKAAAASADSFNLTGQELWMLDFSDIQTPGWYFLRAPGVGVSHTIQISDHVYDQVALASQRGAYHARCGCALEPNLTRFSRGKCHAHDGAVRRQSNPNRTAFSCFRREPLFIKASPGPRFLYSDRDFHVCGR